MNALEAVKQLDKYNEITSALKDGARYLRDYEQSYHEGLLLELAAEYEKKAISLKDNLEKTNLATMRGQELIMTDFERMQRMLEGREKFMITSGIGYNEIKLEEEKINIVFKEDGSFNYLFNYKFQI